MSAQAIKYASGAGVSSGTVNTNWVDVATIAAGSLSAGVEYIIIAAGDADLNGGADECRFRVIRGSTVISPDTIAIEEVNTADRPMWGQLLRDTQPGSAEAIKIQCQPSGTGAHTVDAWLLAIPLSGLTENTDFFWNEVTTDQTIPTAWDTTGANVTFTPNGTDTYLVLACAIVDPTTATASSQFGIQLDSGTPDSIMILEGEDTTNEKRGDFAMWTYTPSAASHTFRAVYQATAGTWTNAALRSAIFVLRLNKFAQFSVDQNAAEIALSNASMTNIAGVDPNPSVTGDWVLLGSARCDVGSLGEGMKMRLQVNAGGGGLVSAPAYGDDGPGTFAPDGRDEQPAFLSTLQSLTSGATREINLDAQASVTNNTPAEDRCLVAFSCELASSGTTLTPGLITQTRAIYAAKVNPKLLPGFTSHTRAIYAVNLDSRLSPAFLTQTRQVYSAQVNPTLKPGFTTQTRAIYSPSVSGATTLLPDLTTHTRAVYSPIVSPQVRPGFTVHTRQMYTPTLLGKLTPAFLTHTRATYSPNVVNIMLPAFLTHTRQVYAAKVNPQLRPGLITHTRAMYMPGVNDGSGPPPGSQRFRPEHPGAHER